MPMAKKKEQEVEEGKASNKAGENPKVANADAKPWRKGFLLRANNEAVRRKPLAEMEEQEQQEHVLVCPLFQIFKYRYIHSPAHQHNLTGIRIRKYILEHITYDRYDYDASHVSSYRYSQLLSLVYHIRC
jgi:hypothetical protein